MSRGSWEATVAAADARGAARKAARARRSERLAAARLERKRARRRAARPPRPPKPAEPEKRKPVVRSIEDRAARRRWRKNRAYARRTAVARAARRAAEARRLSPEVAAVYVALPHRSELRELILAQAADDRRPFVARSGFDVHRGFV